MLGTTASMQTLRISAVYKRRTCGATQDLMALAPQPRAPSNAVTHLTAWVPRSPRLDKGAHETAIAAQQVNLSVLSGLSPNGNSAAYGPD